MPKKNFYAAFVNGEGKIFNNWEDCRAVTKGASNARPKGFATLQEAQNHIQKRNAELTNVKMTNSGVKAPVDKLKFLNPSTNPGLNPIEACLTILNGPPIEHSRWYLCLNRFKVLYQVCKKYNLLIHPAVERFYESFPSTDYNPGYPAGVNTKRFIHPPTEKKLSTLPAANNEPPIIAHTDGSCQNNPSVPGSKVFGVGVHWNVTTLSDIAFAPVSQHNTNQTCEYLAAVFALQAAPPQFHLDIHTDSKSIVTAMNEYWPKWEANNFVGSSRKPVKNQVYFVTMRALYDARTGPTVYTWLSGHSSIKGNEIADTLANKAALQEIHASSARHMLTNAPDLAHQSTYATASYSANLSASRNSMTSSTDNVHVTSSRLVNPSIPFPTSATSMPSVIQQPVQPPTSNPVYTQPSYTQPHFSAAHSTPPNLHGHTHVPHTHQMTSHISTVPQQISNDVNLVNLFKTLEKHFKNPDANSLDILVVAKEFGQRLNLDIDDLRARAIQIVRHQATQKSDDYDPHTMECYFSQTSGV